MSRIALTLLALLTLVVATRDAHAGDGVIEINQARATAGGVTAGDTPGFPVTISVAGSYLLTGNLDVPANTTAIRIDTSDVTVDLGGFAVKGTNVCNGYPVTSCHTIGGAAGILAPTASQYGVLVRNGRVFGSNGQNIGFPCATPARPGWPVW